MKQKTPFIAATVIGLLGMLWMFAGGGCATIENFMSPQRLYAVSKLATYTSCVATAGEPDTPARNNWIKAQTELSALIAAKDWRPVRLGQALDRAGVSEMIGSEGKLVVSGGVALVDLFTAVIWQIDTSKYVEAVATGGRDGIDLALNDALSAANRAAWRYDRAALIEAQLRMEAEATRPKKH